MKNVLTALVIVVISGNCVVATERGDVRSANDSQPPLGTWNTKPVDDNDRSMRQIDPNHPYAGPRPLFVVMQTDPWMFVLQVVVYDNGQVISMRNDRRYYQRTIDVTTLAAVRNQLAPMKDYAKLRKEASGVAVAPMIVDMPETWMYVNQAGKECVAMILGLMEGETGPPGSDFLLHSQTSDKLTNALVSQYSYLKSLNVADATPWEPKYVEVLLTRNRFARGSAIQWPKEWPSLKSPYTLSRGENISLFVPGTERERLQKLLKEQDKGRAIEIDGQRWAATMRYVFPSENVWFRAFDMIKR